MIEDRCNKLRDYIIKHFDTTGKQVLLPPECGNNARANAKEMFGFQQQHPVAQSQNQYFNSLDDLGCPKPHYMCGEQLSYGPNEL